MNRCLINDKIQPCTQADSGRPPLSASTAAARSRLKTMQAAMKQKINGKYFGTEIDEKWYRRYTKNKMFARGNGTFHLDDTVISFYRQCICAPITINIKTIVNLKIGTWHSGQWGGGKPILKILWQENDTLLSSGFTLSIDSEGFEKIKTKIEEMIDE